MTGNNCILIFKLVWKFLKFFNFSIVRSGLGWIVCLLGVLCFVLIFYFKLYTIKEEASAPSNKYSWIIFSRVKFIRTFIISCVVVSITYVILLFENSHNIYSLHIFVISHVVLLFILIPKHYISQNQNLNLYLSVYHCQPPPVLPWQLPNNFDPNSVKLIFVQHKNE